MRFLKTQLDFELFSSLVQMPIELDRLLLDFAIDSFLPEYAEGTYGAWIVLYLILYFEAGVVIFKLALAAL